MRQWKKGVIPYYTFTAFDVFPDLMHAVLTRHGGVSPTPWDSLNLGWTVGDARENVEMNYRRWAEFFGLNREDLTTTWQVHGNRVLVADERHRGGSLGKADALITNTPGIPLVQRYADCTPILLYDPVRHACGIAHAGWRGTVERCAEAAVQAMQREFGCDPADVIGAIGPAIGPCCYEVGPEVVAAIRTSQRLPERVLVQSASSESQFLDLWEANAQQLRDAGVRRIEIAQLCTACHRDIFFSHRGDKGRSGRFAAFIVLKRRDCQ
ncbi:MAG: peptidoglycan editing factor PgeF [Chloroflexi bacterium]|nr:peptidoglycan editing factor PgeF [Chloroflexota bacterium]